MDFGRRLIKSGDLDPVYTCLNKLNLDSDQLSRWLIAYWCFYHCGFACTASEETGADYWKLLHKAARNQTKAPGGGRWPRGSERRHFRGEAAERAVTQLRKRYDSNPLGMIDYVASGDLDVRSVMARVSTHHLFGSWIAFKVADMLDAVVGLEIDQSDLSAFLYDSPRKSIMDNLASGEVPDGGLDKPETRAAYAMGWLGSQLRDCRIPHRPKSRLDLFCLETVWCKHLSHMHGFYPVGKDIYEIDHGLRGWPAETARRFRAALPEMPEYVRVPGTFF